MLLNSFFDLLFDSEKIILTGGIALILLIVYLENGVLIACFFPGDYLLFLSGLYCSSGLLKINIGILALLIFLAAVGGCYTGYFFGKRVSYNLYQRKESRFFKRKYLIETEIFFDKWGGKSIIISRFLPVIRTFIPILAGISKYSLRNFTFFTIVGVAFWVISLVLGGYFLGQKFPLIQEYGHYSAVLFLMLTAFTLVKSWWAVRNNVQALPVKSIEKNIQIVD